MSDPKLIVIGSSAGGLKALTAIIGKLPADLDAAIFVVQHLSPEHESFLPQILSDTGPLIARHPGDRDAIRSGQIYVAPPDHHLLVNRDHIRVIRGPRENRQRPAIDALFRSAARAHGPRVIGVILSGLLDDGTVGAQAIKQRGGTTVVQSPADAEYPSMPASVLRYARVDHALPADRIPALLVDLVAAAGAAKDEGVTSIDTPPEIEIESEIAEQEARGSTLLRWAETIGTRSHYTCPTCKGTLWQVGEESPLRYRCHVGHSFTARSLMAEQTVILENALWSAIRLMEEKADFLRRMADRRQHAQLVDAAAEFRQYADRLEREIDVLRRMTMEGVAARQLGEDEAAAE